MADIKYTRTFRHEDWIDNEDVVQADGERGFNPKFHALEAELDAIATTFATADSEVKKIQRVSFVTSAVAQVTLNANTASPEFDVEIYDRAGFLPNIEKIYFAIIIPAENPNVNIIPTFTYRSVPPNRMQVKVTFFNPTGNVVHFNYRVLSLS